MLAYFIEDSIIKYFSKKINGNNFKLTGEIVELLKKYHSIKFKIAFTLLLKEWWCAQTVVNYQG